MNLHFSKFNCTVILAPMFVSSWRSDEIHPDMLYNRDEFIVFFINRTVLIVLLFSRRCLLVYGARRKFDSDTLCYRNQIYFLSF